MSPKFQSQFMSEDLLQYKYDKIRTDLKQKSSLELQQENIKKTLQKSNPFHLGKKVKPPRLNLSNIACPTNPTENPSYNPVPTEDTSQMLTQTHHPAQNHSVDISAQMRLKEYAVRTCHNLDSTHNVSQSVLTSNLPTRQPSRLAEMRQSKGLQVTTQSSFKGGRSPYLQ